MILRESKPLADLTDAWLPLIGLGATCEDLNTGVRGVVGLLDWAGSWREELEPDGTGASAELFKQVK